MNTSALPPALEVALEALAGRDGVTILEGWRRYGEDYACGLRLSLTLEASDLVPASTDWYAVAESIYPRGDLTMYPAKKGGITATFPHQTYNGDGFGAEHGRLPWRPGNPCLTHPLAALGEERVREPKDAINRLAWQVERLKRWLVAAAAGRLQGAGDPFELPPAANKERGYQIIFIEEAGGYEAWQTIDARQGIIDLLPYGPAVNRFRPFVFRDEAGTEQFRQSWNDDAGGIKSLPGLWILLDRIPSERPWRFPLNWEELLSLCLGPRTNLGELLERQSHRFRDGQRHVLMIGYPIPMKVGGAIDRLHWSAILLPPLSTKKTASKQGFRGGSEVNLLACDKHKVRHGKAPLSWISSANWAEDQIRSRGAFPAPLRGAKIALIGVGALGSMLAELLVRAGANITAVIDPDVLVAGNTCRHMLTLREVGYGKAASIAEGLRAIQPQGQPVAMNVAFPPEKVEWRALVDDADLIIECTGEDETLSSLQAYPWPNSRRFVSLSLGWKAARLYCFSCHAPYFLAESFREQYAPWKAVELAAASSEEAPWEGIGCWHPVFPARAEDVMLGAACAVKFIEATVLSGKSDFFHVYSLDPSALKLNGPSQ